MKNKLYICALAALVVMNGCTDQLDIDQNGNLSTKEDYYKTDEEALGGIAEAYYQWMSGYGEFMVMLDALSDDCWTGGIYRNMDTNLEQINEFTYNSDNDYIKANYQYLYKIVYYSNLIIENVNPDTDGKTRCVAEAHFMRGWANFYLAALWGNPPCLDHTLNGDYAVANSKDGELLALAKTDFEYAKKNLPAKKSVDDTETIQRLTKGAATAWLGKTLLWQGDKSAALSEFQEVLDGPYALYEGDLSKITRSATNNCCENILELQTPRDATYIWSCEGWYTSNLFLHGYRGFNAYYLGAFDASYQMGGLDNAGMATNTWGYINPRKDLADLFAAEDGAGGWGYRTTAFIKNGTQMIMSGIVQYGEGNGISQPGSDGLWYWKNRLLLEDDIYEFSYPMMACITQRHTRLAEIYLLAAECCVDSNNPQATEYVNTVRRRAQAPEKNSVTLTDIKNEKRMELCSEGIRYLDLLRWGDAETVLANQGKEIHAWFASDNYDGSGHAETSWTNSNAGFQSKHKLLPIPRLEMEINSAATQNPGW